MPTVRDIVAEWLKANGYDGLAGDECGCGLNDLMPCGYVNEYTCVAGHVEPCPGGDVCDCGGDEHIAPGKREER